MTALGDMSMDAMVSYTDGGMTAGGTSVDLVTIQNCFHWTPQPVSSTFWLSSYVPMPNKFEQAFKAVSRLLETGAIKSLTLKDFISAVNDVAAVL